MERNVKKDSNKGFSSKKKKHYDKRTKPVKNSEKNQEALKIIPIGGLNEIGKNMTLLEYKDEILIIDCGMAFPEDEMLGIDVIIPDFTYLKGKEKKIKGLIITHGHEDHIGGVPYLLKEFKIPVYGTPLTLGLIQNKLDERNMKAKLNTIKAGQVFRLGCFKIEAIRTTHSIADAVAFSIDTPAGRVFHTGDFKIDYTPIDGDPIDLSKFAEIGAKGVDLLLADSTNALRPGYSNSEKIVGQTLGEIFHNSKSRIVVSTFSSNVHRIQKIIDNAVKCGRQVAISGRSMEKVVELASQLGYLKAPQGTLMDISKVKNIADNKIVIITTGSQGEPMSALARMANDKHKNVQLKKGDTIILSSTPVPGNEKMVSNVVNRLFEIGCEVIYSDVLDVHVSGHAAQEELKLLHSLIKAKNFMPVHGEYRYLVGHMNLAEDLGQKSDNIHILSNGDCLKLNKHKCEIQRNYATAEDILVDGLSIGEVGEIVLNDRKNLSEGGMIIVATALDSRTHQLLSGPDIISRGFVYVKENEELMAELKQVALDAVMDCQAQGRVEWPELRAAIRTALKDYIYETMGRSPIVLPIFMDV
ncbi:MAG: ribonuclease J [Clostridia bacterium]|nr:ribonuclease J [Clostridia bacterium]